MYAALQAATYSRETPGQTTQHTCPRCGTIFEGIGHHCRDCLLASLRASKDRGHLIVLDEAPVGRTEREPR